MEFKKNFVQETHKKYNKSNENNQILHNTSPHQLNAQYEESKKRYRIAKEKY